MEVMKRTIQIKNLAKSCVKENIEELFSIIDGIEEILIIELKNESTNLAFVTFNDEDSVKSALMFNDNPLHDVLISVVQADESYLDYLKN